MGLYCAPVPCCLCVAWDWSRPGEWWESLQTREQHPAHIRLTQGYQLTASDNDLTPPPPPHPTPGSHRGTEHQGPTHGSHATALTAETLRQCCLLRGFERANVGKIIINPQGWNECGSGSPVCLGLPSLIYRR